MKKVGDTMLQGVAARRPARKARPSSTPTGRCERGGAPSLAASAAAAAAPSTALRRRRRARRGGHGAAAGDGAAVDRLRGSSASTSPGIDAYAGYVMAGAGFLALAHTLKQRRAHPRHAAARRAARRARRAARALGAVRGLAAGRALRLLQRAGWPGSRCAFNDISTGNDATPLWIPQLAMAVGAVVLSIAFVDELVLELRGRRAVRGASRRRRIAQ